ncbi:hypothetical protein SLEP1_g48839 [Rubroshorea leprosula]|uniref:Cystinosin homolog n=1 Tax=Rubroshorea leprosula TaxID=152421 RepID=A0AAV5LUX9_9ROSI|nr:hypothetical protein SLEP1_g48839 [Rubroshorea leprosula]
MASWHSISLEITYQVLGWFAFVSWSSCFYPQVILNFRRKSVVGLNFDFALLNLTKHSAYLIYNACLYFSLAVQKQYLDKYGYNQMIPVAANDVAFSIHAVLMTSITLIQIAIYDRGNQKFSKISIAIVSAVWLTAAICLFVALPKHSWLWLISIFNSIQVCMTAIKYTPQVRIVSFLDGFYTINRHSGITFHVGQWIDMQRVERYPPFLNFFPFNVKLLARKNEVAVFNFARKSTEGFSIGYVLFDFTGGLTSLAQMAVQSVDQNSFVNFYGNIGKMLLSVVWNVVYHLDLPFYIFSKYHSLASIFFMIFV